MNWIKLFYNNITSRTINNGWASSPFKISRGLRQGCPLSPYLYVLCAELLAIKLRNTDSVEGIHIINKTFLLSQFADDTQMFLKGTEHALNASLVVLENLEKVSGLKINFEKSECYKIGSIRNDRREINTIHNVKWSKGPINVLGVIIPITDKKNIFKLNLEDKIASIRQTMQIWLKRNLSILGKVNILKSQLLSKLTYVLSVLPNLPLHYIEEIQSMFFKFIWNYKKDKIKRNIQINTIKHGGLSVPDIATYQKSLKMSWVKRYLTSNLSPWKLFLDETLRDFGGKLIFNGDMSPTDKRFETIKNDFHKDILVNWFTLKETSNKPFSLKIGPIIIWNNKNIKIQDKTICYKQWIEKGIISIGDLFINGRFIDYNHFIQRYGITTDFITYHGVYSALPNEWKEKMTNENQVRPYNILTDDLYLLLNTNKPNRIIYWKLLSRKGKHTDNIYNKWRLSFPNLMKQDLERCFLIPYKVTVETKMRNFQYKFLHRILPNNKILLYMHKVESNLCTFCKTEIDSIDHMFWSCSKITTFLELIRLYLEEKFGPGFDLKKQEYFLGILSDKYTVINHIYILLKFYIFRCFITKSLPSRDAFVNYLYGVEETERNIAKINKVLHLHSNKWNPLFLMT